MTSRFRPHRFTTTPALLPSCLLLAGLLLAAPARAEPFTKDGFYTVELDGWKHGLTPGGDGFACTSCGGRTQIQIEYSEPLPEGADIRSNAQFLAALKTDAQRREFAEQMLRHSIPAQSGFPVAIRQVGIGRIGGLDVLDFIATVDLPPKPTHDHSMVAVHKARLLKITVDYYEGPVDAASRAALESFLGSLSFE